MKKCVALSRGLDVSGLGEPKSKGNTGIFKHATWISFDRPLRVSFQSGTWV